MADDQPLRISRSFPLRTNLRSIAVLLLACEILLMSAAGQTPSAGPDASSEAKQFFHARCALCHGDEGEGSDVGASLNAPALRSPAVQQLKDEKLRETILSGRGNMPSFRRNITDPEIDRLIELIRSFSRPAEATQSKQ